MKYFVECNNIFNKKDIYITSSLGEKVFKLKKNRLSNINNVSVYDNSNKLVYRMKVNPLKLKSRYVLTNREKDVVFYINKSLIYIHDLFLDEKRYIIKGSMFKMKFLLYDYDTVISTVRVKRIDSKRYFEINVKDELPDVFVLAMLFIAQAIRELI